MDVVVINEYISCCNALIIGLVPSLLFVRRTKKSDL